MCTAATYKTKDFYMGRTLDYECSYGEEVTITPRGYSFAMRHRQPYQNKYALIGMAHVAGEYPLYYDAINEKGLGMAGLNFVGNAFYSEPQKDKDNTEQKKDNITQFELIPWILGQCASVKEARTLLSRICITNTSFHESMPVSPLHWIIADRDEAITLESVREGIKIYDNPVGVLTNNPPFDRQMAGLTRYMGLSAKQPANTFGGNNPLPLQAYSRGMGALGLPGDLSSESRFARVAFVKSNSFSGDSEAESVSQFFHILGSVDQQRGCCEVREGAYEITIYTSCCNASKGIYYYTTYENHQITAVDMHREDLDAKKLIHYPLVHGEQISWQN